MQDLEAIATALATTVRFAQSVDADAPVLDPDLIDPSSARLIYHPLLTNINLSALAPDAQRSGATFNTWLRNIRLESARTLFMDVMQKKKNDRVTKEMLDNLVLYSGVGRLNDRIIKSDRLVGFEIRLLNSNNVNVVLDQIMTHFSEVENFNLYLFHSESPTAIATIPVAHGTALQAQWTPSGQELNYRDFGNNIAGGTYFLMYDEADLTGQAINQKLTFGYAPCKSCNSSLRGRYEKYSQYVAIQTVSVSAANKPAVGEMFDVEKVTYDTNTTFGLNLALSSYCDLTDYIVNHKSVFADGLSKQVVHTLLRELLGSVRSNVISEKMKDNARFSLQNAELGGENLTRQLSKAQDALGFELSNIQNSVCMPEIASKGIRYGTIGNGRKSNSNGNYRY